MKLRLIQSSMEYREQINEMMDEWSPSREDPYATCIRHASIEEIPQCVQVVRNAFQTVADQFHFTKENAPQFTAYAINEQKIHDLFCKTELPAYVFLQGTKIVGYYSIPAQKNSTSFLLLVDIWREGSKTK